jgi:hypothetical protein
LWQGEHPLWKKGHGRLIQVSDFANEEDGWLVLLDDKICHRDLQVCSSWLWSPVHFQPVLCPCFFITWCTQGFQNE